MVEFPFPHIFCSYLRVYLTVLTFFFSKAFFRVDRVLFFKRDIGLLPCRAHSEDCPLHPSVCWIVGQRRGVFWEWGWCVWHETRDENDGSGQQLHSTCPPSPPLAILNRSTSGTKYDPSSYGRRQRKRPVGLFQGFSRRPMSLFQMENRVGSKIMLDIQKLYVMNSNGSLIH